MKIFCILIEFDSDFLGEKDVFDSEWRRFWYLIFVICENWGENKGF